MVGPALPEHAGHVVVVHRMVHIVTFTTVGYGDISPRTTYGKWIGAIAGAVTVWLCTESVLMLSSCECVALKVASSGFFGLLFMAMPLTIVGGSFHNAYLKLEKHLALKRKTSDKKSKLLKHMQLKKQKSLDKSLQPSLLDSEKDEEEEKLPFNDEMLAGFGTLHGAGRS